MMLRFSWIPQMQQASGSRFPGRERVFAWDLERSVFIYYILSYMIYNMGYRYMVYSI